MKLKMLLVLVVLVPLTACASMQTPQERAERAARIEAAAGAPVNYIRLIFRSFYAWDPINDHQVVAYVTPTRAYLLDLPPCPSLEHTASITITSKMDRVSVNFDSITPTATRVPCHIRQIRPLDMSKLKQANLPAKKGVQVAPRVETPATHPDS